MTYKSTLIERRGSLSIKYPEIAKEWHPIKNGVLTPNDVTPSSNKRVYWLGVCGHEWIATINNRTNHKSGCGICCTTNRIYTEQQATILDKQKGIQRIEPYIHSHKLTTYLCPKCNMKFLTRPSDVWRGDVSQCNTCRLLTVGGFNKFTEEEAINKDTQCGIHRIDIYQGAEIECRYKCPMCGSLFSTMPISIWTHKTQSCGCLTSKGNRRVAEVLSSIGIIYEREHTFTGCVDKGKLRFDFYIQALNLCIEYQGIQHYIARGSWASKTPIIQRHDQIKRDYCYQYGILLLEIPYTQYNNIEQIIKDYIV